MFLRNSNLEAARRKKRLARGGARTRRFGGDNRFMTCFALTSTHSPNFLLEISEDIRGINLLLLVAKLHSTSRLFLSRYEVFKIRSGS